MRTSERGGVRPTRKRDRDRERSHYGYVSLYISTYQFRMFFVTDHFSTDSTYLLVREQLDIYIAHGPLGTATLVYKIFTFVANISVLNKQLRCEFIIILT